MSKRQSKSQTRAGKRSRMGESAPPPANETTPEDERPDDFERDESVDPLDEIRELRSRMSSF